VLQSPHQQSDARQPDVGERAPKPALAGAPAIRLQLLDGFALTRGDAGVDLPPATQHLVAFLAVSNRAVNRAQIAGTLWDSVSDLRAAGNLRSTIWRLRQLELDLIHSSGVYLSVAAGVAIDIRELERLGRTVMDPSADVASLELERLPLKGELLPGWSDEWVLLERERQRQISLHVLDTLCHRWTAEKQYDKAVRAGLAAVAGEPLRESSNRALIIAFLAEGNPTEAIRHFNIYRRVLRNELDLEPSVRFLELIKSLRDFGNG
jgi:DNA-binding SARP family transcriptional activator